MDKKKQVQERQNNKKQVQKRKKRKEWDTKNEVNKLHGKAEE